jgi:hypothetical protein
MTDQVTAKSREAQRFMDSLGASETVPFGHYGKVKKFGTSGHICILSEFPGSATEWLILSAGDVEALSALLSELIKSWKPLKDEKKRGEDERARNEKQAVNGK